MLWSYGKYCFTYWVTQIFLMLADFMIKYKKSHLFISPLISIEKHLSIEADKLIVVDILFWNSNFCLKAHVLIGNKYCVLFSLKWWVDFIHFSSKSLPNTEVWKPTVCQLYSDKKKKKKWCPMKNAASSACNSNKNTCTLPPQSLYLSRQQFFLGRYFLFHHMDF